MPNTIIIHAQMYCMQLCAMRLNMYWRGATAFFYTYNYVILYDRQQNDSIRGREEGIVFQK